MASTKKRVLAVDDSTLRQRMYEMSFKIYTTVPVELAIASDGQDALTRLAEHPDTDLVLLDINMPGMTGLECLERIRKEPALKRIRVILVSTEDHRSDVERGGAAGAVAYLIKPFTPQQLHELLDDMLVSKRANGR